MTGYQDSSTAAGLRIRGLHKRFGDTTAVDGIDLTVPRGSFYGLVGPNGAGKTTTLAMAVGLLRPDRGTAEVLGADVWREPVAAKARLGVLLDADSLPLRLTGCELLTYLGLLRGLDGEVVRERCTELLDVLDMTDAGHRLVADYSTGMRKKIALAAALLHGPEVLVLDEPFEAVDPVSAATIRSILGGFIRSCGTIVLSSHVMAIVEQICDHVAVLAGGELLAAGPIYDVRGGQSLDEAFARLVGYSPERAELSWFAS
ncbi:ABC transporter ATP-binding protein [Rudaeicoccus suwonensis]|uniref:ABC-2 type transport system ATP-binding protein n=1 Tax=Rudaeicoccus suwonensis TaxID=657409 RepID=A0A561E8F9_9MICO|nr:ABC transporter ATP-binding protein [Rudaeicoccus suwonensis]TWE11893.1 ABC-2 type transport system ATP-binding protein [Rudaeicoccus suwonensis]